MPRKLVRRSVVSSGGVSVGIDPSLTALGVATFDGEEHETWLLKPKLKGVRRLREIQEGLQAIFFDIGLERVDAVVMEGYSYGSRASQAHKIGEGGGSIKLAVFDTFGIKQEFPGMPYVVSPNVLKKFITGRGKADKNEILLACYKKWGAEFSNDNEADAYGLSRWGWAKLHGTDIRYEQECLTKFDRE